MLKLHVSHLYWSTDNLGGGSYGTLAGPWGASASTRSHRQGSPIYKEMSNQWKYIASVSITCDRMVHYELDSPRVYSKQFLKKGNLSKTYVCVLSYIFWSSACPSVVVGRMQEFDSKLIMRNNIHLLWWVSLKLSSTLYRKMCDFWWNLCPSHDIFVKYSHFCIFCHLWMSNTNHPHSRSSSLFELSYLA